MLLLCKLATLKDSAAGKIRTTLTTSMSENGGFIEFGPWRFTKLMGGVYKLLLLQCVSVACGLGEAVCKVEVREILGMECLMWVYAWSGLSQWPFSKHNF